MRQKVLDHNSFQPLDEFGQPVWKQLEKIFQQCRHRHELPRLTAATAPAVHLWKVACFRLDRPQQNVRPHHVSQPELPDQDSERFGTGVERFVIEVLRELNQGSQPKRRGVRRPPGGEVRRISTRGLRRAIAQR
ncbi:hypothetical protein [Mycolicibacterium tokaiense]|uniref:hypothetical protein n=1 Tax=Mycolicibacterium tokaiense TaxID=39695 RepID=UPI0015583D48|nr:hypothetical protein [Mycolicibacterium tokaiense]